MANFSIAYKNSMKIEVGYANDPNDSGGETWNGIARKYHPNWAGWKIVDEIKGQPKWQSILQASATLERLVQEFYKTEFWDVMMLDQANDQAIANELFDTGLNMHYSFAVEFLQAALNCTNRNQKDYPDLILDGKIGPKTIATLNSHPRPKEVLKLLNCQQGVRYMNICKSNPVQEKFMTSWLSRVEL